jgi:hypothetical protein
MMKCDRYQNLLMRHFDHELEGRDREDLDRHLLSCRRCRALREDLTGILGALEDVVPVEPDADLERLVLDRIMSLPAAPVRSRDPLPKVFFGTLAALTALLFLVLGLSFQGVGYLDLVLAAEDYTYWLSGFFVNLQIAYGIVSGLFSVDVFESSREILAVSVVSFSVLLLMAVKAAFRGLAASEP